MAVELEDKALTFNRILYREGLGVKNGRIREIPFPSRFWSALSQRLPPKGPKPHHSLGGPLFEGAGGCGVPLFRRAFRAGSK
ncbi:MAG: hypothetical protein ACUVTO_03745 [Candidatus Caldatribacteriaceae bacterium]